MAGPKPARWSLPIHPDAEIAALSAAIRLSPAATRVLWTREIRTPDAAEAFLRPSLASLHDPYALADMPKAAARLAAAVHGKQKILLYGDYDVDGTSSVVILITALRLAGATVSFHVPHRVKEGYGMRTEVVEQAAADGVALIVSVDTGIRASAVVAHASQLGIDVIVTDHHLPEGQLPPALAVLNPNRADCPYPAKNLCGAAVALKLAQALFIELGWEPARRERLLASFLKLAAIATVADVVPLTGENRIIVKHGLEGLRDPRNLGLKALFSVARIPEGRTPSARQVGFQIGPRINAAGRMDDARNVVELFLTTDPDRAKALADSLDAMNKERQATEQAIRESILDECSRVEITDAQAGLVFSAPDWHQGVVGIVAGRLAERYSRPVFVLSEDPATGEAKGSGRSPANFHLLAALEHMPDLFLKFGGHAQAAGLTMHSQRIPEFRQRFADLAASILGPEDLRPTIEIDTVATLPELDEQGAMDLLSLAPFGAGNRPPMVALLGAEIAFTPEIKNEKHLFLKVRQGGVLKQVKGWNMAENAALYCAGDSVDLAVLIEDDAFSQARGGPAWGLEIKDLRPAKTGC
jgi:single-stranded-DNA-specific exonuclease